MSLHHPPSIDVRRGGPPARRGKTMRGYIVLLAVGIVAGLIGRGGLAPGFSPQTHPLFFAISAGANHYVRYQFSVVTGGSVSGTFTADSGTVNVWVMTDAQHTAFIATGTLTYLSATSGASGAFSADLPSGATYFVETGHGSGYESTVQTGTEDVTINALPTAPLVRSVVISGVGAVLLGVGLWWRKKPARPAAIWSTPPPYMPPGAYSPPPMPGGVAPPPSGLPQWAPGSPVTPLPAAVPLIGTVLVTVENGSATDETVDLLANGVSVATLQVVAVGSSQSTVRVQLFSAYGATLALEAVSRRGPAAPQVLFVAPQGTAPGTFPIQ